MLFAGIILRRCELGSQGAVPTKNPLPFLSYIFIISSNIIFSIDLQEGEEFLTEQLKICTFIGSIENLSRLYVKNTAWKMLHMLLEH